jgi:excisionase family DNA binding protein
MDSAHLANGLPPVLSTEEVGDLLRLNARTVLAMARDGRLPGHRLPGCRKVQYLTAEILTAVADAPGIEEANTSEVSALQPGVAVPAEVDPCDIWGAAPSWEPGDDWRQRCLGHWVELARQAGLSTVTVNTGERATEAARGERAADQVDVDGLLYAVLVGPRQRTRYVDDEGEVRWGLIDAVWVEPVAVADQERTAPEPAMTSRSTRGAPLTF